MEAESGLRLGRIKKSPVCDRSRILIGNECVSCFCHQNSPKTRRFQPFLMAFTRAKRAEMEVFQGQTSENEALGATWLASLAFFTLLTGSGVAAGVRGSHLAHTALETGKSKCYSGHKQAINARDAAY